METFVHAIAFLISSAVIWFFAGLLIEAIDRVARRFHQHGFVIAFFILGLLTSISEISVATNALVSGVPQVSAGNLIGASFVILLLIIPVLAMLGGGISLRHTLSKKNLDLALAVIVLPSLFTLDGDVTKGEGILLLLIYFTLMFAIRGERDSLKEVKTIEQGLLEKSRASVTDGLKIFVGGAFIFIAGHFLVDQAVYFSGLLGIPESVIGLILLSVATNVPELVIAARAIMKRRKDIAFGDYVGSAATNTLVFAFLPLIHGNFTVATDALVSTAVLMVLGLLLFSRFARSMQNISRNEGFILLLCYEVFLVIQLFNILK